MSLRDGLDLVISALAPTIAVLVASRTAHRKLDQIHLLVNSRLTAALEKIERLEDRLEEARKDDT